VLGTSTVGTDKAAASNKVVFHIIPDCGILLKSMHPECASSAHTY